MTAQGKRARRSSGAPSSKREEGRSGRPSAGARDGVRGRNAKAATGAGTVREGGDVFEPNGGAAARPAGASLSGELIRQGIPVSGGLSAGPAHLILEEDLGRDERVLEADEHGAETRRFRLAVRRSRDEIQALKECLTSTPDDPGLRVLDAHLLILEDQQLIQLVLHGIREDHRPASEIIRSVFQKMIVALESSNTEYFRARSADIRDVGRRLLRHLNGHSYRRTGVPSGAIVVAVELSPSETASFDPVRVKGLVTDLGGATSHAAILARSRGIPAVVGLGDLAAHVAPGDWVLVDGTRGEVVVRPTAERIEDFESRRKRAVRRTRERERRDTGPAVTQDSHPISLLANIETPEDVTQAIRNGAEGIGLFRTEFFFLGGKDLPDEEGQYRTYRRVLRRLKPRPVTIRTLDVGGDKFASYLGTTRADNPYLGVRGIRFLLQHREILRTQLRAILRAAPHGQAQILFPMISAVEEVRAVNQMLEQVSAELRREGQEVGRIARGIMIEVPAAVTLADLLAHEVDFFSIGSNDLIQYTLAVDRGNERVGYLYDPFHPAVLRALAATISAGERAGVPVSSCGEMSGNPYGAAVLIGLGCHRLSMSPVRVSEVKDLVRRISLVELRRMTNELLRQPTGGEVRAILRQTIMPLVGDDGQEMMAPPPMHDGSRAREESDA